MYPEEQAEAYWRDDKEVMASGKAKTGIIEPMETSQGTRLVQTSKIPYVDEQGAVAGVIGFALDITEQKQAEEALNKSERIYRAIGESLDYGIWICDPMEETLTQANRCSNWSESHRSSVRNLNGESASPRRAELLLRHGRNAYGLARRGKASTDSVGRMASGIQFSPEVFPSAMNKAAYYGQASISTSAG